MSSLTLWIIVVSAAGGAMMFGLLALVFARPRNRSEAADNEPVEAVNLVAPSDEPELERLRNVASFAAEIELDELCAHVLRVASPPRPLTPGRSRSTARNPTLRPSIRQASRPTRPTGLQRRCMRKQLVDHHSLSLDDDLTGSDERIGTLVLVPLRDSEGEPIGNLAALWRWTS